MATTITGWVQPADVARLHGMKIRTDDDQARLDLVCDGLNQFVREVRPDLPVPAFTGAMDDAWSPAFDSHEGVEVHDWNPRITLGMAQLAHDWYTGLGDAPGQYDEIGLPPPAVSRSAEMLLEVNRSFRPVVA